jgi:hypothetical protein
MAKKKVKSATPREVFPRDVMDDEDEDDIEDIPLLDTPPPRPVPTIANIQHTTARLTPMFAASPAEFLAHADFVDYGLKENQAMFRAACAPLPKAFDGTPGNLKPFIDRLTDKAALYGWRPTLGDLLTHYARTSTAKLRSNAIDYLTRHCRDHQNSVMIYHCISASLTEDLYTRLTLDADAYTITMGGTVHFDGPLFLKLVIDKAHANIKSTTSVLRGQISDLSTYMSKMKLQNITEFNRHLKAIVLELRACGEKSEDILTNLFRAYLTVSDSDFHHFIMLQHSLWIAHQITLANDGEDLMNLADGFYRDAVGRQAWNQPSLYENQIIALTAQVNTWKRDGREGITISIRQTHKPTRDPAVDVDTTHEHRTNVQDHEGSRRQGSRIPLVSSPQILVLP